MAHCSVTPTLSFAFVVSFLLVATPISLFAQFAPDSAHVNLYFPQVLYGGPESDRWNMEVTLTNPSGLEGTATVNLSFFGFDGEPLGIVFEGGTLPAASMQIQLPPNHTKVVRSVQAPAQRHIGWLYAFADAPTLAYVTLTKKSGTEVIESLGVMPTVPASMNSFQVRSTSTISVANIFADTAVDVPITLFDPNGRFVRSTRVSLPPAGHASRDVGELFPNIDAMFLGLLQTGPSSISGSSCPDCLLKPADMRPHVASGATSDGVGSLIGLPRGNTAFPKSHRDEVWYVFHSIQRIAKPLIGDPNVYLTIITDRTVNAYARNGEEVGFSMGLAELIGDSRSEIAAVIGHEFGHIYQQRFGVTAFDNNKEHDADFWGLLLGLFAGYDPYAAAGALAKLSMATGRAALTDQIFEDIPVADAHQSFNTRLSKLYDKITFLCSGQAKEQCQNYKTLVHPHLPDVSPLSRPTPISGDQR